MDTMEGLTVDLILIMENLTLLITEDLTLLITEVLIVGLPTDTVVPKEDAKVPSTISPNTLACFAMDVALTPS
jgi:hypothetical protein